MPPRLALYSLLLLLGAAFAYLAGNGSAPLLDRDEPRYALTSRNMLASGNYVVPRQYDAARTAKPPLIYWLQSASMRVFGNTSEAAARLPSALAMLALVGLVLLFFWRETDAQTALLTATVFASAALTGFVAKMAITDASHVLFTAVLLACTYRFWRGDRAWSTFLVAGITGGLSLLTKGYIAPAICGMTAAALFLLTIVDRRYPAAAHPSTFPYPPAQSATGPQRTLVKALIAVSVALAIFLPWVCAVLYQEPDFFLKMLRKEAIERTSSLKGVDGQARPPGFYLLTVFGTYFPYSLLLPAAVVIGFKNRHRPLTRFCLAAAFGPWLMFEAVVSKMVHWFLPVFLPLAYLIAEATLRCWRKEFNDLHSKGFTAIAAVGSLGILAAGAAAFPLLHQVNEVPWWVEALVFLWALYMGTVPFLLMWRRMFPHMIAASAAGMALLYPLVFAVLAPNLWFLHLPRALAADLIARGATNKGEVLMVEYKEPSLAFYQGGTIREAEVKDLARPGLKFAVIPKANWDRLGPDITSLWTIAATHKGKAYASSAKDIDVHLLQRRHPQSSSASPPLSQHPAPHLEHAMPAWTADPQRIAELERTNSGFNYREENVAPYTLPDLLRTEIGRRVTTAREWESLRRPEILDLFAHHVYGRLPAASFEVAAHCVTTDRTALGGHAVLRHFQLTASDGAGNSFSFPFALFTPSNVPGQTPCFLLINNGDLAAADPSRATRSEFWPVEEIIARGYATAVVRTADVDPDEADPEARAHGVRGIWPNGGGSASAGDRWGSVAAWGWGACRVLDFLQTDPAIDAARVALIGHSRGGKAALWASANDPRFTLTISNESGETGAALARRRFGETVARINTKFPHWFADNYKHYNDREDALPVDQHELLALIAPRPLYVASAAADLWADPKGEFLSLAEASKVYALYAQTSISPEDLPAADAPLRRGNLAYHLRSGPHNLTLYDWRQYLGFADELWGRIKP